MRLSAEEIARLLSRYLARQRQALRQRFIGRGEDAAIRARYVDAWVDCAASLEAIRDEDVLCILEIGYRHRAALTQTEEYKACIARKHWYGRGLWLRDRLERMGFDVQPPF